MLTQNRSLMSLASRVSYGSLAIKMIRAKWLDGFGRSILPASWMHRRRLLRRLYFLTSPKHYLYHIPHRKISHRRTFGKALLALCPFRRPSSSFFSHPAPYQRRNFRYTLDNVFFVLFLSGWNLGLDLITGPRESIWFWRPLILHLHIWAACA